MARTPKKTKQIKNSDTFMSRASQAALDNPVAAGGSVVMGLTACLIVANAVGLQPGRHPAPLFTTRERPDARSLPETGSQHGGLRVQEISTLVLDLQSSLRKIGLYEGPLDGLSGPATERAIRAFERRAGYTETGQASEALLAVVLMQGEAALEEEIPAPRAKPGYSGTTDTGYRQDASVDVDADRGLQQIQQTLSELGYGPLKADGLLGANTTAAIKRFELDRGLPLTGEPGPDVVRHLEKVSGRSLSG